MNWTRANKNEPKAKDPKWYLKALTTDLEIGLCNSFLSVPPPEKYQIATQEAKIYSLTAPIKALFQRPPKT